MDEHTDWAGWLALLIVILALGGALLVMGYNLESMRAEVPK